VSFPILSLSIHYENDTVAARQRARPDLTAAGVRCAGPRRESPRPFPRSHRNAYNYAGGGRVEYLLEGRSAPQLLIVKIMDSGPGIRNLDTILEGQYESKTGMGSG